MKVLIVKLSSLGDVVHTLPAVYDIAQCVPNVQIDWVVEKGFAPLLKHVPAVDRVIEIQQRQWRRTWYRPSTWRQWRAFKAQLQAQAYDAIIDAQGLTKSALIARLAKLKSGGKRYALGLQTEGASYEATTRWVADVAVQVPFHVHAVDRSRLLCAQALGYAVPAQLDYGLRIPPQPLKPGVNTVAFVFATSRQDKFWPQEHWLALGHIFLELGYHIALPHGSAAELAYAQTLAKAWNAPQQVQVWPRYALDVLQEYLARTQGVIGVDSGPSHIAVALGLPHVQIYNFDTAWRTGPQGCEHQRSIYAQPTPTVQDVWQAWLEIQ